MSTSSLNHAGAAQNDVHVGSDSSSVLMSQSPNHSGPVQPDPNASPYVSVHGAHAYAGSEGYPHHVMPYAVPGAHQVTQGPPELMYAGDASQPSTTLSQSQPQPQTETPVEGEGSSPPPSATNGSTTGKRKQPDVANPDVSAKRRRQRASGGGEDAEEGQDAEVGPNGGAKHWTEEEKTGFFKWMLRSDEHWDAFRTRMNTVFRECSTELFPGRKSYTALKSCYHRNLEVFKQIHAFQVFSANHTRHLQAENPNAEGPPVDTMLEIARVAGLNVGSLNVKAIDRWYETGWYDLFKNRYREDSKTGLPAPYYGPADQPVDAGPSSIPHAMMGLQAPIDPQLAVNHSGHPGPDAHYPAPGEGAQPSNAMAPNGPYPYSPLPDYRQAAPSATHHPPPLAAHQSSPYLRTSSALPSRSLQGPPPTSTLVHSTNPPAQNGHSPFRTDQSDHHAAADYSAQTAQTLAHLTVVTEALLGVCSSLKELLLQQAEESRARTERIRAEASAGGTSGEMKEKEISIEKVTFATEVLKNGPQNEEIKKAAIECLTKYLTRGL